MSAFVQFTINWASFLVQYSSAQWSSDVLKLIPGKSDDGISEVSNTSTCCISSLEVI